MASITKIKDQYRVRFFVYLPDGCKLDRSRRAVQQKAAREIKAEADVLEAKTKREEYTDEDLRRWIRSGLLTKKDADQLRTYHDGRKTLRQAADEYKKTWGEISSIEKAAREGRVERIVQILGENRSISDIRHLDGELLKKELRSNGAKIRPKGSKLPDDKLKAATVNKYLQDLKRIFNLQIAQRTIEFHPFAMLKGVKVPHSEKISHRVLSMEEIANVLDGAEIKDQKKRPPLGGNLTLYLLMFFGCGLRRKEAMDAKIENVNWENRILLITKTKTGQPRKVGLGQRLFTLLSNRKGETGPILPPFHKDNISRVIIRHFKSYGIVMRLHDTRHTYTTSLLDAGVTKRLARTRTGHADDRMLDHYDHPETEEIFEDNFDFMHENNDANGN